MVNKLAYLFIDIGSIVIPFLFSHHYKFRFSQYHNAFWKANALISVLFIAWDILFTHLGIWNFNPKYIMGLYFFNLPIEEVLFFFCIPYSSIFTYHCLRLFFSAEDFIPKRIISVILMLGLFLLACQNYFKLYTSVTFFSLVVLIALVEFKWKVTWLNNFYFMYLIILIPFFIVNGLLTGTGLDEPIVSYNNNQNLSFRMLTIPFEDLFYGMLLLLLNTFFYEFFKREKQTNHSGFSI